jgi:hypothetical protein
MRPTLLVLLIALTSACDSSKISPHLAVDISLRRASPTAVAIEVRVKNEGERGTVPLDVLVTTGADQRVLLHPVPFVLNRHEVRDLKTTLLASTGVRATLTVREAERGLTVVTKTASLE